VLTRSAVERAPDAGPGAGLLRDPIGSAVGAASERLGATCLLESRDGRLVAHHVVGEAAPVVIEAILGGSSFLLQDACTRRRTLGVVAGGAIQSVQVDGWRGRVLVIPVAAAGLPLGWLWALLPPGRSVDLEVVAEAASEVSQAACELLAPADEGLLACLSGQLGGRLPRALKGSAEQVWVAAVRGPADVPVAVVAGLLALAVRRAAGDDPGIAVTADDASAYLLLWCRQPQQPRQIQDSVETLLASSPDVPLRGGLSSAARPSEDLSSLRRQAELVLEVAQVNRCASLAADRAALVLRHVQSCLADLPGLGPDPLDTLLNHDAKRQSELARALLAWLDAHGDVAQASSQLAVHHNTLRYRLGRARSLLAVDLDEPVARLEVHLRLRQAMGAK
jgi:hypothetical protein